MTSKRLPRKRRDPQAARALILEAATRVFAELGPDRAGLKEVAAAAGVSHALVTHYFGTFDRLVEEVLEQRMTALRRIVRDTLLRSIGGAERLDLTALLRLILESLKEPANGRLMAWAYLSGRLQEADFFVRTTRGLRSIVDAAAEGLAGRSVDRQTIELLVVVLWCALTAYAVAGPVLWEGLGRPGSAADDDALVKMLGALARQHLRL